MWYTQYNSWEITQETKELYTELLKVIFVKDWPSLYHLWMASLVGGEPNIDHPLFNNYFHEVARREEWLPCLSDSFTKTARKRYDIAVLLAYIHNAKQLNKPQNWDYSFRSCSDIKQGILEKNVELLTLWIIEYITSEEIDIGVDQIDIIVKTYFKREQVDSDTPYDKDAEIKSIAILIAAWNTNWYTDKTSRSLDMERID